MKSATASIGSNIMYFKPFKTCQNQQGDCSSCQFKLGQGGP